jgi:hypothetical protein
MRQNCTEHSRRVLAVGRMSGPSQEKDGRRAGSSVNGIRWQSPWRRKQSGEPADPRVVNPNSEESTDSNPATLTPP